MKQMLARIVAVLLLFAVFFATPGTASAATTLTIAASKASGVYYADSGLGVSLYTYPGATIVYTTNGTYPVARIDLFGRLMISQGYKYTGTLSLRGSVTVRAIALMKWTTTSPTYTYRYEVYAPTQLAAAARAKHSGFDWNNTSKFPFNAYYTAATGRRGYFSKTYSGIKAGTVNCTWYAFSRIKYNLGRDILFTSEGGLNGGQWYGKIAPNSSQVKYSGSGALDEIVRVNGNRPVYNIVVSFPRNGTGTAGHVMLIDAIINGKLYYSDNSQPGVFTVSNTIADFKARYQGSNGTMLGAVHLK